MKYKLKYERKPDEGLWDYILQNRGIDNKELFLKPSSVSYESPTDLKNIEEGWKLIEKHKDDKIVILCDCDQDGYTSTAIIYLYLQEIYPSINLEVILHSGKQHGLEDYIEKFQTEEVVADLLIVPDAGSNDNEYHKILKEMGMDILVIDHHEINPENLQNDYAVIINNQDGSYHNRGLSGAGVTWKFCKYIDTQLNTNFADYFIDLAAIGIIGDMMPLNNLENRYIIDKGLKNIRNPGIKALIQKQAFSMGDKITPIGIAFYITPLVNALIRVGTMSEKETLLNSFIKGETFVPSTKRGAKAGEEETIADQNARNCVNARSKQNRIKDAAVENFIMQIRENNLNDNKVIVVTYEGGENYDSNLNGLIAMNLVNYFNKPCMVVSENEEGFLRGSARCGSKSEITSFKQFLLDSGMFEYAEGHAFAFGVSIKANKLDKFIEYANKELANVDFSEGIYGVDFIYEKDSDFKKEVLEIGAHPDLWGQDCEEPLFVIKNIPFSSDNLQIMGKNQDTIKITYNGMSYLKFKAKDFIEKLNLDHTYRIDILGRANLNEWGGQYSPQIFIDDFNLYDTYFDF